MASEDYSKQSMEEVSSQFTEDTRTEKEKTEEVIEAVQKNRVIWFKGHPQYKIKEARDAGWIEAARMVRLTGKLLCLQWAYIKLASYFRMVLNRDLESASACM